MRFIRENWGWLSSIGLGAVSLYVTFQAITRDVETLKSQQQRADNAGTSFAQQTRWVVDKHADEIRELKAENRATATILSELRSDMRMVAEYVREQKQKQQQR